MKYYYDNKNKYSPVQPVMSGGKLKDWIGYDHSAVAPFIKFTVPSVSFPGNISSGYYYDLQFSASNKIRVVSNTASAWCSVSSITDAKSGYVRLVPQSNGSSARNGVILFETIDGLAKNSITVTQEPSYKTITLNVNYNSGTQKLTGSATSPVSENITMKVRYYNISGNLSQLAIIIIQQNNTLAQTTIRPIWEVGKIVIDSVNEVTDPPFIGIDQTRYTWFK